MSQENSVQLTQSAIKHIKNIIARRGSGLGFYLKLKTSGCSGFSYAPEIVDQVPENTEQLQQDGLPIFIASDCVAMVKGTVIDLQEKSLGQVQLIFNNPQAKNECGCGESFNVDEQAHE